MMPAKINHSRTQYQGRVFTLATENVTLGNGVTTDLDVIHHPGAAAMVPLTDDNKVVLLKQYRHAVGQEIWEIPAGTLEMSETPRNCAAREIEEETGYTAANFIRLGKIIPVPGYSDETITLFLCSGLTLRQQKLDADEQIAVYPVPFDEAIAMIHDGRIQDAKSIAGLFMARRHLEHTGTGA
jgi:ADP-ribose pyrophosphatase